MNPPDATTKALILSNCLGAVVSSPEAWRAFEHEAQDKGNDETESFDDWAIRKAGILAKDIWERVNK